MDHLHPEAFMDLLKAFVTVQGMNLYYVDDNWEMYMTPYVLHGTGSRVYENMQEYTLECGSAELISKRRDNFYHPWRTFNIFQQSYVARFSRKYHNLKLYTLKKGWIQRKNGKMVYVETHRKWLSISDTLVRYFNHGNIMTIGLKNIHDVYLPMFSPGVISEFKRLLITPLGPLAITYFDTDSARITAYPRHAYLQATTESELVQKSIGRTPSGKMMKIFNSRHDLLIAIHKNIRVNQLTKFYQVLYRMIENDWEWMKRSRHCADGETEEADRPTTEHLLQHMRITDLLTSWYQFHLKIQYGDTIEIRQTGEPLSVKALAIVWDYVVILKNKRKVNLNIGVKRMKAEHDAFYREQLLKETKRKVKYLAPRKNMDVLTSTDKMKVEFITSLERLIDEGTLMHHCVGTYAAKINSGRCVIYSILYQDKRYTVELARTQNATLQIGQLKGAFNAEAPDSLYQLITSQLSPVTFPVIQEHDPVPAEI